MANTLAAVATSYVATVVAITTDALFQETAAALETVRGRSAVRTILITLGDEAEPTVDRSGQATIIQGLLPRYVDNVVAALRLSSLPTVAWWRRPEADLLDDIAHLVDRVVLDAADPASSWARARQLREVTSFSDLRWTRLTRWRSLMAQFFELPDVRSAADAFTTLTIAATDADAARLYAAWLRSRLPAGTDLTVTLSRDDRPEPVTSVDLQGDARRLGLRLLPNNTCVETVIQRDGQREAVRVVPLGNTSHVALLSEEMRVRSRDIAFEEALEGVDAI